MTMAVAARGATSWNHKPRRSCERVQAACGNREHTEGRCDPWSSRRAPPACARGTAGEVRMVERSIVQIMTTTYGYVDSSVLVFSLVLQSMIGATDNATIVVVLVSKIGGDKVKIGKVLIT
ncbi:hypothetical protein AXF42_Ash017801 [Apostasia shenzhenica]|uniref:Uncharacterized protein n=1 Tax=Apostasia shenzhenica TaxID=1088818 RepID=A0A2I0A3T3_9ASPA|nr:hypothetical protein AXF42_Ash017801 [Apostasia shenzhenica]